MDLQLDEEQELLAQSITRYLERELPFETRSSQRAAADFMRFWEKLDCDLDIGSAGLPQHLGGFGGGPQAEMIVASALGRSLAVTPYITSQVLSATVLAALDSEGALLAKLLKGRLFTTAIEEDRTRGDVALVEARAVPSGEGWRLEGRKLAVDFAAQADVILIPARVSEGDHALFACDAEMAVTFVKPYALIDDTPSADLLLDDVVLPQEALIAQGEAVPAALQSAVDRTIAAVCAEASGIADVIVDDTIAYAKERRQFGVAIASFQALQHRMVDMWTKAREIEAASLLATLKLDQPAAITAAKATVSDGLRLIGQEAVQLHGAMGLTEELRIGHYFKRATVIEHTLGSAADHVERYRRIRCAA